MEEPKNPDTCNVYNLYKLIANPTEIADMRKKYETGGFGYGHAKIALLELILTRFEKEREIFSFYMNDVSKIDTVLLEGAQKASKIANEVLKRTRKKLGLL